MNTFLKILGLAAVIGGSLVTAGVLPAVLGGVFAAVGTAAMTFHPSVQASQMFGKDAK